MAVIMRLRGVIPIAGNLPNFFIHFVAGARMVAHEQIVRDAASKTGRAHADERDEVASALRGRPATA